MGFEMGALGAVLAFLGMVFTEAGRLALPGALLALLAISAALWSRLRRLTRAVESLTVSVTKALETQRLAPVAIPAPPSPTPRVRYTKRGVPYMWDPIHGSRFVKKEGT
jgi:hypothetical protein